MNIVKVGMADVGVAFSSDIIRTCGLGSCVGVTLWDPLQKVAGMAHVMLPESGNSPDVNRAKYADTAIPMLLELLETKGAFRKRLVAKLAGGAQMFTFAGKNELMRIGPRNVEAVYTALSQYQIPIVAEETGGNCGRTIEMSPADGILVIRTARQGVKTL